MEQTYFKNSVEIINFNIKEVKVVRSVLIEYLPEWNINEAWIKDKSGRKIIDFLK